MQILFLPHGQDIDDLEDRYGSWHDVSLTQQGRVEAEIKSSLAKSFNIDFELIVSSSFKRAFETAEILSKDLNIPLETNPYLKEINSKGIFSGMKKSEVREKFPTEYELIHSHNWQENINKIPGAEKFEDFEKRMDKAIDLLKLYKKNLIVIGHGGTIGYLKRRFGLEDIDYSDWNKVFVLCELEENQFSIHSYSKVS